MQSEGHQTAHRGVPGAGLGGRGVHAGGGSQVAPEHGPWAEQEGGARVSTPVWANVYAAPTGQSPELKSGC